MEGYRDKDKWINLNDLPHKSGKIDWKNSVGKSVYFQYGKAHGKINIIGYKIKKSKNGNNMTIIKIFIPLYMESAREVYSNTLKQCKLKDLVGNKIIDYRPDIVKYLVDKSDAYRCSCHMMTPIRTKCQICGNERNLSPDLLCRHGFTCPRCSDGISIPNKIMRNILEQLDIDFKNEVSNKDFKWIEKYFYDFYFKSENGDHILIEMDGGFHRYDYQQIIDKNKSELADKNGFKLIRIRCDYAEEHQEAFEYIKNNILHSDLRNIIPIDRIDWIQCQNAIKNNILLYICKLWEQDKYDVSRISSILKMHRTSICTYLKRGANLGLAPTYNTSNSLSRSFKKPVALVENNKIIKVFSTHEECSNILSEKYNIKFIPKGVQSCANGSLKTYHGLQFKHITREEYLQYKMIEDNIEVVKDGEQK